MAVYLSIGIDKDGHLHDISGQRSGKGALMCPFCKCPLIAAKGVRYAAHFRHDGDTCNESLTAIPEIPGWHHFHLNFTQGAIDALHAGYDATSQSPTTFKDWLPNTRPAERKAQKELYTSLLKQDEWTSNLKLTDTARVIVGDLALAKFSDWMRAQLQTRIVALRQQVSQGYHPGYLDIEASRQQNILNATLYLFEYQLNDGQVIHKIGRTRRDPAQRLAETRIALADALGQAVIKSQVLKTAQGCGHVEQYALHRYQAKRIALGSLTEYLQLDKQTLTKLKSDITRLTNQLTPLSKAERFITTGRWRYETKRLDASRRGIRLTLKEGGQFGRPVGTKLAPAQWLTNHADIVTLLERGKTTEQCTKLTGKSRSTVKRVRKALYLRD